MASANPTAQRQLLYELISGLSGLALALFMLGHLVLVGSILTGAVGFNWLAGFLEDYYIAQPTVIVIAALFLLHAVTAARKIPAGIEERRRMIAVARQLKDKRAWRDSDPTLRRHDESMLWVWQVVTGLVILVLGSFHIGLLILDVLTPLFGEVRGIEAATTLARVAGGLWLPYAVLLVCVEFHASVGLYRLAVKWGLLSRLSRRTLRRIEQLLFWSVLGIGFFTLLVLAGWLEPPLAFLTESLA